MNNVKKLLKRSSFQNKGKKLKIALKKKVNKVPQI